MKMDSAAIPVSYQPGMRVPGWIYATSKRTEHSLKVVSSANKDVENVADVCHNTGLAHGRGDCGSWGQSK